MRPPRVAYFPDSFHEVNGVAHTSRNFAAYAARRRLPFLCVRAGTRFASSTQGEQHVLELPRSRASVGLERDLAFDPLFWRHADLVADALHRFQPDILHMTGPSELSMFAAYFADKLQIPLAASWHTNVHEYAARRLSWATDRLAGSEWIAAKIEQASLGIATRLYQRAQVLFAPNEELCAMLGEATARPCHLMRRGVDTELFSPAHRSRADVATPEEALVLGYVGRLSVEKNVALLPAIAGELAAAGLKVRFALVGHGAEEAMLRRALPDATFAGVLRGLELSRAYADMDLLVFPSHTDTFGNVVLEALASGVPALVTPDGGPKFIVRDAASGEAETGVITEDAGFAGGIETLLRDPERLRAMGRAARAYALTCSWDAVFDRVYLAYRPMLERADRAREAWEREVCERVAFTGSTADSSPG